MTNFDYLSAIPLRQWRFGKTMLLWTDSLHDIMVLRFRKFVLVFVLRNTEVM